MTNFFKTATIGTIALLAAANTNALTPEAPMMETTPVVMEAALPSITAFKQKAPKFNIDAKIGIARLDNGRLIAAPMRELRDWAFLDNRSAASFAPVSPAAHIKNIPEVPMMGGRDSDNKLDEIRMTASDLNMDYVLIYGMGKDARWGSFAGKAMINTGLKVMDDQYSPAAKAKALLVNTYTGEILGTVTSSKVEFGVGDLTDKVETLIKSLNTDNVQTKA